MATKNKGKVVTTTLTAQDTTPVRLMVTEAEKIAARFAMGVSNIGSLAEFAHQAFIEKTQRIFEAQAVKEREALGQ